jgi:uncharacterized phage-like protein YoqJ
MIISCTGHRPNKLPYGYDYPSLFSQWLQDKFISIFKDKKPKKIISGMALGVDTIFAITAIEQNIPLLAAIPFLGQEKIWPKKSQIVYNNLLSKAKEKIIVSDGAYSAQKMQIRNEWMVDNSDILVAVFNGSKGGTANCYSYAFSKKKEIILINPDDFKEAII